MRRVLLKTIAAIVLLAAIVGSGGYVYLRRSLPQIDRTTTIAGISAPIDIIRDADATPHIFAANKADALFGLGYVHAQDRLWQMELQRRIGFGRLSEVLGAAALPQDRFLRTVGFGRAAKQRGRRRRMSWTSAWIRGMSAGDPAVREFPQGGAMTEALGSNNWVVDGTLTATGKPLLANDPHLSARLPSTWYLAHVSGGDFEIIGATLPGAPAVALGRNRFIAWGATNVAADVEDLYRERVDATGKLVEFRGAQEPITAIPETIIVKGSASVHLDVRVTRHGPLISDAINANNAELKTGPKPAPLAFRWVALDPDDGTLASFLKVNEARSWSQFTDALKGCVAQGSRLEIVDS